ncbi:MAG: amidohydrolase family protein, partial [Marmoricola sp.]
VGSESDSGPNALTMRQALTAYTHGSAVAAYADHRRGVLAIGKDADLTLFDRNLLSIDEDQLADVRVRATVVGGEIAHSLDPEGDQLHD